MRRSVFRVVVLSLVTTLLALGLASPVRASYYEHGVSLSTEIIRDSVPYRLNIKAVEAMGSTYRLEMSITRSEDPPGLTVLRQKQTWTHSLEPHEFYEEDGGYRIDAGSEQGSFRVNVTVQAREGEACSDTQRLFVTEADAGGFRIETGNETFGTITELPSCASHWSYGNGPLPGPPKCPIEGLQLDSPVLNVKEPRDGDSARISIYDARQREISGDPVMWWVRVSGRLPSTAFRLDRNLTGGLRAGEAPWLSGRASFEPNEPAYRDDWYNCKGNREARNLRRAGAIGGTLTLDVIGYEDYSVTSSEAVALRSSVRPRS